MGDITECPYGRSGDTCVAMIYDYPCICALKADKERLEALLGTANDILIWLASDDYDGGPEIREKISRWREQYTVFAAGSPDPVRERECSLCGKSHKPRSIVICTRKGCPISSAVNLSDPVRELKEAVFKAAMAENMAFTEMCVHEVCGADYEEASTRHHVTLVAYRRTCDAYAKAQEEK